MQESETCIQNASGRLVGVEERSDGLKAVKTTGETRALLVLLAMGGFGVMGTNLIAPGLPSLAEPFHVGDDALGPILSIFSLSAAVTLPFSGLLLDLVGARTVGVSSLVIHGISGFLCALAPSYRVLLILRLIQGAAAGALIPTAMVIITRWREGEHRLRLIGFFTGAVAGSAAVFPLLGGILAMWNWRYPFYVHGLSLLLAVAFGLVFRRAAPVLAGGGMLAADVRDGLIFLLRTLKTARIRMVFTHTALLYFLLYTLITFIPLFVVRTLGGTEALAGLVLSAGALTEALVASQAGRMNRWLPGRMGLSLGFALCGVSLLLLSLLSSRYTLFTGLILFGVGMGITQPAIHHQATSASSGRFTGSVLGLFNAMKSVGMSLAPALLMGLYASRGAACVFFAASGIGLAWLLIFNLSQRK
ncbi:MAG: MFS transporter [Bacillota bacterium]